MVVVGQQLLQPEQGWIRYNDTSPNIKYFGTWSYGLMSSYYDGDRRLTSSLGAYVEFEFTGSDIRIIGALGNAGTETTNSTRVEVTIDNNPIEAYSTVSSAISSTQFQIVLYQKLGLPYGVHKVRIENKQSGKNVTIDAIDINPNNPIKDEYLKENLEKNLREYGIAWIGFDETSGNYLDKLGNGFIATPTNITRTMGWNGEGLAASTTKGAVNLNKRFDIGPKTFKFKIRCRTVGGMIMSNYANNTTNGNGIQLLTSADGSVSLGYYMTSFGVDTISLATRIDVIKVNQWHEIMLTIDNVKDGFVKIYIDGKLEGTSRQHKSQDRVETGLTYFLRNSFLTDQYAGYSDAEIDDLQIYSKVLTPSDFSQKRLAVKTMDNKSIVVSNISTRVKELPDIDEDTLLKEGHIIREIDSAIDKPSIDLTRISKEYELINKTNKILGNGKMFTIPITDFKTVTIEDNY